jgi:hypothetical protein
MVEKQSTNQIPVKSHFSCGYRIIPILELNRDYSLCKSDLELQKNPGLGGPGIFFKLIKRY